MDKCPADVFDHAQWAVRVSEWTVCILRFGTELVSAYLATSPTGTQTLVVNPIERHTVAVSAKRIAVLVISAHSARVLIFVSFVVTDRDHGDDAVIVEGIQTILVADSSIGDEFSDLQVGEALAEMCVVGRHDPTLIPVCRVQRRVGDPIGMEFIVTEDLRVASVAIDIARTGRVFLSILVAACVMDQARLGVARRGQAAALATSLLCARAALESLVLCGTRTGLLRASGLVTGLGDLTALHRGMGFVQHTVSSDGETSVDGCVRICRALGKQTRSRDECNEARTEVRVKDGMQGFVEATHGRSTGRTALSEAKQLSPTLAFWPRQHLGQALPA